MNELDISKAIQYLKPNAEFSFEGTDYSTINWHVLEGSAPTWLEIEAAHQAIKTAELQTEVEVQAQRQALLDKLGITEEEAKLLLS